MIELTKSLGTARICVVLVGSLVVFLGSVFSSIAVADDTVVYLVRHAEKDLTTKTDPALTERGQERAERWAEVFKHVSVTAVYSTDTRRTRDTAVPLAQSKNVKVELYEVGELDASLLQTRHPNEVVFIVGHSNTIPDTVNTLAGEALFQDLDESEYNDLFRVQLSGVPARKPTVDRFLLPLD